MQIEYLFTGINIFYFASYIRTRLGSHFLVKYKKIMLILHIFEKNLNVTEQIETGVKSNNTNLYKFLLH